MTTLPPRRLGPVLALAASFALIAPGCAPSEPAEPWTADQWHEAAHGPVPPGTVRLRIHRYEVDLLDQYAVDAFYRYRVRNLDLSLGGIGGRNGLRAFVARDGVEGALRTAEPARRKRIEGSTFMLLREAARARVDIFEPAFLPWRIDAPVYRGGIITERLFEEVLGTGLYLGVRAVRPNAVSFDLWPIFEPYKGFRPIELDGLRTRITLSPGRSYVFLQSQRQEANVAHALFTQKLGEQRQVILVLEAEVGANRSASDGLPPSGPKGAR